jgi:hypothetical protein
MNSRRVLSTALCAILAYSMSSTVVLGQIGPKADRLPTDNGGDLQSTFSETTVNQSPDAGCCNLGLGQSSCDPRWTASADFIILDRVGSVSYTLVEKVSSSVPYDDLRHTFGPELLNANDLHQGFAGGPRLSLIHHGDNGNDFEVSYFQIDGWNVSRSIGPTPHDWLIMRAPGNFLQTQNDYPLLQQSMVWDYESRLYNAEVNVRRSLWPRVTVLAGFRWVNLTEDFEGILLPPTTHGTGSFWNTQTKNNLYGLQIGADAKLLERGPFSIDGVLKTGLFDDRVDEATSVRMLRLQYPESASTNHLAFLGEIGVQCKYQVTRQLSFKAGYEAIWLQGVALAPAQITNTYSHYDVIPQKISVQALGVNCTSGVFYHGATTGLEYSF